MQPRGRRAHLHFGQRHAVTSISEAHTMTSLASERSWLLDPSVLKLVHQCRRLIHTEFGVKLHLTEEHLDQQLAEYARKTRSTQLIKINTTIIIIAITTITFIGKQIR